MAPKRGGESLLEPRGGVEGGGPRHSGGLVEHAEPRDGETGGRYGGDLGDEARGRASRASRTYMLNTPDLGREGGTAQRTRGTVRLRGGYEHSEYSGIRLNTAEYVPSRPPVGAQEYVLRF